MKNRLCKCKVNLNLAISIMQMAFFMPLCCGGNGLDQQNYLYLSRIIPI